MIIYPRKEETVLTFLVAHELQTIIMMKTTNNFLMRRIMKRENAVTQPFKMKLAISIRNKSREVNFCMMTQY